MSNRLLLTAGLLASFFAMAAPQSASAQATIKDHRTNPDVYFLEEGDLPNSLELLPGPPDAGSIAFLYDRARYDWGKSMRKTPRGEQAFQDARVFTSRGKITEDTACDCGYVFKAEEAVPLKTEPKEK